MPERENLLTPFMLESGQVRGRVVRLGSVAATILSRYNYPPMVVRMLGELLAVAALLSGNLKSSGIFTIQIRGKGLVPLMVVDATAGGTLRGYAEVSPEADAAIRALTVYTPQALVGAGAYLAITLDPGEDMQRYQGIVALEGESVAAALMEYFVRSEQLDVQLRLAVEDGPELVVAGIMIERMPGSDEGNAEAWRYAQAMLGTLTPDELLAPLLATPLLLYRMFHEEGVRVYDASGLAVGCRCSRERITQMLLGMSAADRRDMLLEDGHASVHCHFCNKTELFTSGELGL